jgi:hypothetical protein
VVYYVDRTLSSVRRVVHFVETKLFPREDEWCALWNLTPGRIVVHFGGHKTLTSKEMSGTLSGHRTLMPGEDEWYILWTQNFATGRRVVHFVDTELLSRTDK